MNRAIRLAATTEGSKAFARGAAALIVLAFGVACTQLPVTPAVVPPSMSLADILKASQPSEWRRPDPANTWYIDLSAGRIVIELAPRFAPLHANNIQVLVHESFFDCLSVYRVQDNFVAQWGDADETREVRTAARTLAPEFTRALGHDLAFTQLPDGDLYAPEVGFVEGFPAARDPKSKTAWLVHCYAMVGAGRGNDMESGSGSELYVNIGQAPRQLDRNIALVGRVLQGMELLSSLPRGTGPLGIYEKPEERTPIVKTRLAADVPESERTPLEVLRTDSASFQAVIELRRNRRDDWYKVPAGHIDICNIPIPVRPVR
jgi:cyclophilin family peptidyl-prolyl cis-trans isomerase